jgi:hypothetical protein
MTARVRGLLAAASVASVAHQRRAGSAATRTGVPPSSAIVGA